MQPSSLLNISKKHFTAKSDKPLYQQLHDLIKHKIVSGKINKNDLLPPEKEFIDTLGLSRITVRRALNELASSGLVRRQRGLGTVVTFDSKSPTIIASFDALMEGLTRMGLETEVQLLSCKYIKANKGLAPLLEMNVGDRVQKIVRLRLLDSEPFSYLVTHIPSTIAEKYDQNSLANASLLSLLEQAGHPPHAAQQTITAIGAEASVAAALKIAPGAPIMQIHRIMRDKNNKIIQEITAHYRADRFQYQMELQRTEGNSWQHKEW